MVNTIGFQFDLIRFRKDLSVCISVSGTNIPVDMRVKSPITKNLQGNSPEARGVGAKQINKLRVHELKLHSYE